MKQPEVILSTATAGEGSDYYTLWQEGLALLQELSSDIWTDYNEHDPGVTILENLCYALTELSYKANLPIPVILASKPGGTGNEGHDACFPATSILPCNPVTVVDYRKLVIDIPAVRNAWLDLVPDTDDSGLDLRHSLRGLYKVYVQLVENQISHTQKESVKNTVLQTLHSYRSISQDIFDVVIQSVVNISFAARINVSPDTTVEELFATILVKIQDFLSPSIPVYSLSDMMATGASLDNIINGPLPENGFILDSDLTKPVSQVSDMDIVKIISGVEGINSVEDFILYIEGVEQKDPVQVARENVLVLDTLKCCQQVTFVNAGVSYQADTQKVLRLQSNEKSRTSQTFKIDPESKRKLAIPVAAPAGISDYFSIQRAFPNVYGLGNEGVDVPDGSLRNAQRRQMKAYLLFFEQVMADYLQQLSQVADLFSLNKDLDKTYFFQALWDVPYVVELLKVGNKPPVSSLETFNVSGYMAQLRWLNKKFDPFYDRRGRFLDNMLARFNEQLDTYMLSKFDPYDWGDDMSQKLIDWKIDYLGNYVPISRDRGRAFDYTQPCWTEVHLFDEPGNVDKINVSGLVKRVSLMLGIEHCEERSLVKPLDAAGIDISPVPDEKVNVTTEELFTYEGGEGLQMDVVQVNIDKEKTDDAAFNFVIHSQDAVLDLLSKGIEETSYFISASGQGDQQIVYYRESTGSAVPVYYANSLAEAEDSINKMIRFLREISIKSEGMHFLEHLLLRPDVKSSSFSFDFVDPRTGMAYFTSIQKETLTRRDDIIKSIAKGAGDTESYHVTQTGEGTFEIQFSDAEGNRIARSAGQYSTQAEAEQDVEVIMQKLQQTIEALPAGEQKGLKLYATFSSCTLDDLKIDEQFFAFNASVVLPNWPARFQNEDFQGLLKTQMVSNKLALVSLRFFWLDVNQMRDFEALYEPWLSSLRPGSSTSTRNDLSMQITEMVRSWDTIPKPAI